MVFRPGGSCLPTEYNTYQGFAATSLPSSDNQKLDKALEYLKEIMLNLGNNEMDNAKYVLMWIADLFQHPGTRPGVALILSGPQGVGKDTLGSGHREWVRIHPALTHSWKTNCSSIWKSYRASPHAKTLANSKRLSQRMICS